MKLLKFPVEQEDFRTHVIKGLKKKPKKLSPKFFYDKRGSEFFEKICDQPEYYVPNIESSILSSSIKEIQELTGSDINLLEFGSGASVKTRILLKSYTNISTYLPVDISEDFLEETAKQIDADFPNIQVTGISADFTTEIELPKEISEDKRPLVLFFPGSSIGNFEPEAAIGIFKRINKLLRKGDFLLIGADRRKDPKILESAYNDAKGMTAEFNKNIMHRIRDEFGASIDPESFDHKAFYNSDLGRMEMHLVSKENQEIKLGDEKIFFEDSESVHTECSYKFEVEGFVDLFKETALKKVKNWSDPKDYFSVILFKKEE